MQSTVIFNKPGGFEGYFIELRDRLVQQPDVNVGEWQSQHKDEILMRELLGVNFEWQIPEHPDDLRKETGARFPWAEDHFLERVGGEPLNPSPSEAWWPFRQKKDGDTNTDHKSEGNAFSHTYPERMWPKLAGEPEVISCNTAHPEYAIWHPDGHTKLDHMHGIRFDYGDLGDVVRQLIKSPMTRQAYLPIWFPEDTGAVHGKRVPCTLGYHFLIRNGRLHISYFMRSTDLLRHFQDDVYMAGRLAQWVVDQINHSYGPVDPENGPEARDHLKVGNLFFHTANMHIFAQDEQIINYWKSQGISWFPTQVAR